ncbi:MAG: DNA-processing protein DprA [Lachnospiraceae bacterium]|nr:DNA-processing protein DprA [Lachnospiraceae bacterium]
MSEALYRLLSMEGLGSRSLMGLLTGEDALPAEEVLALTDRELKKYCVERLGESARALRAAHLITACRKNPAGDSLQRLQEKEISLVTWNDKDYPERLRDIPDPPFALYYRGALPSDRRPSVAIVGSRMPSPYGRSEAVRFAKGLADMGFQIISGMARGIDGIAGMEAAMTGKNASFAVLGSGVDVCYPKENRALYDRLIREGGVLSEYIPGTQPKASLFPPRNRIISALSDALLVVEAKQKSGTMITVDMSLEQGRDVFAVPGRNNDATSAGCNSLIAQGAQIAISPIQFLELYGSVRPKKKEEDTAGTQEEMRLLADPLEDALYALLSSQEVTETEALREEAQKRLHKEVGAGEMSAALLSLQLKHLVKEEGVGYYRRE